MKMAKKRPSGPSPATSLAALKLKNGNQKPFSFLARSSKPTKEKSNSRKFCRRHETRVGLKRNETTHQVDEGDLYSPSYVRLCRYVALGFGLAGIPNGMKS